MGLLEATHDTIHHYPELVAGFVNNVEGYFNYASLDSIPGLYNTTLVTQVVKTSKRFHLTFTPDDEAKITITGPLKQPEEREVNYTSLGEGVFGDTGYELILIPGGQYRMNATFSDGRTYTSLTEIPSETKIEIPDSIGITVNYTPYHDGSAYEASPPDSNYYINFRYPENTYLVELQSNTNRDREQLLLEPDEHFLFEDRSPYLRDGSLYSISMVDNPKDSLRRQWGQDLYDKKKEEVWHSKHFWMRFSFFNDGIENLFHPMVDMFSHKGERFDLMFDQFVDAYEARNPSYLLDVSTIQKINESGKVLAQNENDAIGFFAGYFSVYGTTTLYALRTFDLDSVLSNNRVYNPDGSD